MAWYAVYKDQQGEFEGFITDGEDFEEDSMPIKWDSQGQAEKAMKGHILEPFIEYIEL